MLLVAALLALAKLYGVFDALRDPSHVASVVVDLGGLGYLAFVLAYAALNPFGVPGTVFIVAAPLIWPWPIAYALSMIGTMCASVVGFSFSRFVARDLLASRIPARFKRYEDALERRAFLTVFLLRLVFWMPFLLHAFFGVSKVKGWTHFWASLAGYALPLFLVSYFGQRLFDLGRHVSSRAWVAAALAALATALALVVVGRRRRRRASPRSES